MNDDPNTPRSEGDAYGAPMDPIDPATAETAATDTTGATDATTEAAVTALPEPVGGDPGAPDSWQPSWKTWVAVGLSAAVVGAAAVFGISAATSSDSSDAAVSTQTPASGATGGTGSSGSSQEPGAQRSFAARPGAFGTIKDIDGDSFTVGDQSGTTIKVVTTDDTTVAKSVKGTVDDIKVGDTVMVIGDGTTTIAATRITDNGKISADDAAQGPPGGMVFNGGPPPGAGQMPGQTDGQAPPSGQAPNGQMPPNGQGPGPGGVGMTRGVVKSVGDGTFTVTGMNDTTVTVTTSSSTEVSISKVATLGDLEVGDSVMVLGTQSDGTLTATSIWEGTLGGGPRRLAPGTDSSGSTDPQQ